MECRETQTLLSAFHDGELPAADRARVEDHLRGCPECAALLADLARVDRAAGVPDPGPAYWDRFNARVMDRVARGADGPGVRVLRPKGGWMREQLRYLVPAAVAAALVVVIVHYGRMRPGTPTPAIPPAVSAPAAPDSAGERMAKAEPESDGQGLPGAGAGGDATGSVAPARAKKGESAAPARHVPPPVPARKQIAAVTREERDRLADRSPPAGNGEASRDRAAAPMAEPQVAGKTTSASGMGIAQEPSTGSPCELARTLAERERMRDAEAAQRACLAGDLDGPSREKGLVFLAELLDRQARFPEADAVIAEVEKQYPQSRPLDLYRRQRPMVQKEPTAVPVTR
jgi:anti-sigma factor RsiW